MNIYSLIYLVKKIESEPAELNTAGSLLYATVSFIFVLILIYLAGMFLKNKNMTLAKSKNIEIVERISIGVGNVIAILKCGNEFFLVSITKEKTTLITKLDENSLDFDDKGQSTGFSDILNNFIKNDKNKSEDKNNE